MSFADFEYSPANGGTGTRLAASAFADRGQVLEEMREDIEGAGLMLRVSGALAALLEDESRPLGELVLIHCPRVGAAEIAALARLDMRAARSGTHLIVSTSVEALDDVFASLDESDPQILVDPTRAERVIALGRVIARAPALRLRELSQEDRLTLLRLSEQVGHLAARLESIEGPRPLSGSVSDKRTFRLESPSQPFKGAGDSSKGSRAAKAPLPDAKLVRQVIRQRQLRARFFDGDLFADPAWDILLDLTAARVEQTRVSVSSLCIASGVPPTTALRWIGQMTETGLLERVEDDADRRRVFIQLTDKAADAMARYFAELGRSAGKLS